MTNSSLISISNLSLMEQVQAYRDSITKAQEEINRIQGICSHPKEVLKKFNYAQDGYAERTRYYSAFCCGVCGLYWTEDQKS